MYVDYEQTINDKIESSGFLRVKKTFSADDDRGYFETGTIVKAVLKRRNQACFVLKLYPFFESNGYPLLYTPDEDKAVCATFLINGKTNEWFDEWFEVDKEINEVEQNYNKLTENHEKKIDVVVFPIIAVALAIFGIEIFSSSPSNIGNAMGIGLLSLLGGAILCWLGIGIIISVGKRKTMELRQKFEKLMGTCLK